MIKLRNNKLKNTTIPLVFVALFLVSMSFMLINQPNIVKNEKSNIYSPFTPISSTIKYDDTIYGYGDNRTVRLFMKNTSSSNGVNYFNISTDYNDEFLNKGEYNFTFEKSYDTNYTLEDDTPLKYPKTSLSANNHIIIENANCSDPNDFPISIISNKKNVDLNISSNFQSYQGNILGFQIKLEIDKAESTDIDFLMNISAKDYLEDDNDWVETDYYYSTSDNEEIIFYIENKNLRYLNSATENSSFLINIYNETTGSDFDLIINSISIDAVTAEEVQINENQQVALEFDLKGNSKVYGFQTWIRSYNTTDTAETSNLTIQLYETNNSVPIKRSELLSPNFLGNDIPNNLSLIAENSYINYSGDESAWFSFNSTFSGVDLSIGNYFIVIKCNSTGDHRDYSLVSIPWDASNSLNRDPDAHIDHLLLKGDIDLGNWELVKIGTFQCDASSFEINLTRPYLPSEIDAKIEEETIEDAFITNYPHDETGYYAKKWWGLGVIDHIYETPIESTFGNIKVNITWDTSIYSEDLTIENVDYAVEKYYNANGIADYFLNLEEEPKWNVTFSFNLNNSRYNNWEITNVWYFIPLDWEINGFTTDSEIDNVLNTNTTYPHIIDDLKVLKVNSGYFNSIGTDNYTLSAISPNYIRECSLMLDYNGYEWPTNGFMEGDNVSITIGVLDNNDFYLDDSGKVTARLFNTTGELDTNYILQDQSIDENETFSYYLFETNNHILNEASDLGKYNIVANWTNGEEVGIIRQEMYVNKFDMDNIEVEYNKDAGNNKIKSSISSFDTDTDIYNINIYAVRNESTKNAPDYQINKTFDTNLGNQIYLTQFLQNETFFNAGEKINFTFFLENRHTTIDYDITVITEIVYQSNEDMIISQNNISQNLAILGDSNGMDKKEFNITLEIPTVADGGINYPIRNSPLIVKYKIELHEDTIYEGAYSDIFYYSNIDESIFDGEILDTNTYTDRIGPSFIGSISRQNLELPENVFYFFQIDNNNYMTMSEERNFTSNLNIEKLDGEIKNFKISQSTFYFTSIVNLTGNALDEYGNPLRNTKFELYYDNKSGEESYEWLELITVSGDNFIITDKDGEFNAEVDLSQVPISGFINFKSIFIGNSTQLEISDVLDIKLNTYNNDISSSIDTTQTLIKGKENILEVKVINTGNSTLENITIELIGCEFEEQSIYELSPKDRKFLLPQEYFIFKIYLLDKHISKDNSTFNITLKANGLETSETLIKSNNFTFDVYRVNEDQIWNSVFIGTFAIGSVLLWAFGIVYIKRKVEEINKPLETASDLKDKETKKRTGKYVKVSELEKATDEDSTTLDDLLDENKNK